MPLDIVHPYTGNKSPRPVYAPGFTELRRFIPWGPEKKKKEKERETLAGNGKYLMPAASGG